MAATLRGFFIALVMLVILTGQGLAQWTLTSAPVTNINGIVTDGSKIFVFLSDKYFRSISHNSINICHWC